MLTGYYCFFRFFRFPRLSCFYFLLSSVFQTSCCSCATMFIFPCLYCKEILDVHLRFPPFPFPPKLHQFIVDHRMTILPNNKPWLHERSLLSAPTCRNLAFHMILFHVASSMPFFKTSHLCVWYSGPLLLQCFPLLSHLNLLILFWWHC